MLILWNNVEHETPMIINNRTNQSKGKQHRISLKGSTLYVNVPVLRISKYVPVKRL